VAQHKLVTSILLNLDCGYYSGFSSLKSNVVTTDRIVPLKSHEQMHYDLTPLRKLIEIP